MNKFLIYLVHALTIVFYGAYKFKLGESGLRINQVYASLYLAINLIFFGYLLLNKIADPKIVKTKEGVKNKK